MIGKEGDREGERERRKGRDKIESNKGKKIDRTIAL